MNEIRHRRTRLDHAVARMATSPASAAEAAAAERFQSLLAGESASLSSLVPRGLADAIEAFAMPVLRDEERLDADRMIADLRRVGADLESLSAGTTGDRARIKALIEAEIGKLKGLKRNANALIGA